MRLRQNFWRGGRRYRVALFCLLGGVALVCGWRGRNATPRAWAARDVPVAFWAWRDALPTESDVTAAARATRARALFLRAGQFDFGRDGLRRIRAAADPYPRALPLHLTYNATPDLLAHLADVDEAALARLAADTYATDAARAARDGAQVAGLQLDIDVPTRLLSRYARVLRQLRPLLPPHTQLSITGLPTWLDSLALPDLLAAVDFWTPQCYGALVPQNLGTVTPITSPAYVARTVARARALGRPFYVGLAAYGYAVLYTRGGAAVELRGNLDPARVAHDPNFELIARRALADADVPAHSDDDNARSQTGDADAHADDEHTATRPASWRYVFRARADATLAGLNVRAGEHLMLETPSAELLRACARAARREAGAQLLGLCVFRLPNAGDATTLTLAQVAAALNDTTAAHATELRLETDATQETGDASRIGATNRGAAVITAAARPAVANNASMNDAPTNARLSVTATNTGVAGALLGSDAFAVTLAVPAGTLRGVVALEHFAAVEPLCGAGATTTPQPCSLRRANLLRLRVPSWSPGARARAVLQIAGPPPPNIHATLALRLDDGRASHYTSLVTITQGPQGTQDTQGFER